MTKKHQLRSGHFLPGKRTVSGVPPPHGICLGHPAGMGHLGPATRGDRVFVQVAYDFDYVAEDGSQVIMRENEILLLINKTNHDWWQVRQKNRSVPKLVVWLDGRTNDKLLRPRIAVALP